MLKANLHLHSSFSDGENSPEELVREAIRIGYPEIAVTDHVRRSSDWLDTYSRELTRLKEAYSHEIILHSGIEAKVINLKGDIDARDEFFRQVDLVLASFHRIPTGEDTYLTHEELKTQKARALDCWFTAMMNVLENDDVDIIAHPTSILKTNEIFLPSDLKKAIARKAGEHRKVFELNSKYQVPDGEFISLLKAGGVILCFGSDSHSVRELESVDAGNYGPLVEDTDIMAFLHKKRRFEIAHKRSVINTKL